MPDWRDHFQDAPRRHLFAGDHLFRGEDRVTRAYLLDEGEVAPERALRDGTPLGLALMHPGQLVAEAALFARSCHCDAVARSRASVRVLARSVFLARLEGAPPTATALLAEIAQKVQRLRGRIEVLRHVRVADRLDAWLAFNDPPARGHRVQVARDIGISPQALYRERARRRARPT